MTHERYLASKNKNKRMRVYPSILLQVGDLVESPSGNGMWYVRDIIEWIPMLCDGTHVFCPRWGFYIRRDYWSFVPLVDNNEAYFTQLAGFNFEDETT